MKIGEQPKEQKRNNIIKKATGVTAGATIAIAPGAYILKKTLTPLSDRSLEKLKHKYATNQNAYGDFESIYNKAETILKENGLKDFGVKIKVFESGKPLKLKEIATNSSFKNRLYKNLYNNLQKQTSVGANAFYEFHSKTINIGNTGAFKAVFHEIGHAFNYKKGGFYSKYYILGRKILPFGIPIIGLGAFGIGLLHDKKQEAKESPKSKFEKVKDFIHDNAGKITFLNFLHVLIEEGRASLNGVKLAKPHFTPQKHKELAMSYLKGSFCSYLKKATYPALAVALGIFIKDKIVQENKTA